VRVAIVGGGVIGLACGWYLAREGASVVVIERRLCGGGASLGNAGWITPGLSSPIPALGVTAQALRWMVRPDSPFLLRPRLDPALATWLWRFWRSSRRGSYLSGMRAMLALNARTLELYDELRSDGVSFESHADGLIFLFLGERALHEELDVMRELQREGYRGTVTPMTTAEAQATDPAIGDAVAGAIHAEHERHVRPETLTSGLRQALEGAGAEIREHTEVVGLERRERGWRVSTSADAVEADRVVVAAGAWTGRVLAALGLPVRQEPAKGYSVTAVGSGTKPLHPLYLGEAKVGCSPFEGGVRLAGTLELTGIDLRLTARRLAAVTRSAETYLRDWRPVSPDLEWAGLRPLPADSLPLIGRAPGHEGLFVATGHGMLGITLAPATGSALAPLVLRDEERPELVPFRIDR
jgi:D-amino-acid dehydrogenase